MNALTLAAVAVLLSADLSTPWEHEYVGDEATGPQVLGLWKFDDEKGLDATSRQPKGELRNGKLVATGRFGGALESFAGHPEADRSHGFVVPNNPRLSPSGAFTVELWIKPKAEFVADEWVHIAATYDGRGRVRFFRNGESFGGADVARGASWPGRIAVTDSAGRPIDAVIPLHIEIRDSDGRAAEGSGHYGAAHGELTLKLDIATNDKAGVWEVRVRELASGMQTTKYIRVRVE